MTLAILRNLYQRPSLAIAAGRSIRLASTDASSLQANSDKAAKPAAEAYIKITMTRSLIGLNRKLYRVAHGLGLTKRGRSVFQPVTPGVAGSVLRLKEIVKIEHATKEQMKTYEQANKPRHTRTPASSGYKVIGNILEMQKEKLSC